MTINCKGEDLILSKHRAIYWEAQKMLIISDLHLGKGAYFRKAGIQIPVHVNTADLNTLTTLILEFNPDSLLITGDMFHHQMNSEAELFRQWRLQYPELKILLIKGNHDTLKAKDYSDLAIEIYPKEFLCKPFRFIHDQPAVTDDYYNITGHIHPGVTIYGKARQLIRLPCFYFGKTCAILPAFSAFTGLSKINAAKEDLFYAITPEKVVLV
ncbi:DNA ligase-associated metallophosphoesterase [Pedobacter cryoconitis]|uniref:DNA ligase-associated metallophosphoesterase n=1 Tax=Pedobacter cryoconitis TaxID=188932 RepID=A0A7W9E168_9SPHI|nr:ligase-associated DNA damage response endonuclease PdeM [Pedobacter cryoconitis]MBB5638811.1 DNA ligase-associated metallophosphoesterase [Pedobacter cryoconitis]MBB6270180.1 DNA ligase-associated metallophosphoesterase [Pedobacter cryoconitis]